MTFALVLFALWLLLVLPLVALCQAAALSDQISASLLPVGEGVANRQNIPLGRRAAHVGLPRDKR